MAFIVSFKFFKNNNKLVFLSYILITAFFCLVALNIHYLLHNFNVLEILSMKQRDFFGLAYSVKAHSIVPINKISPNIKTIIATLPQALFNAILRPLYSDISSLLILLAFIENIIVILIIIYSITNISRKNFIYINIFMLLISYSIINFAIIGLTTPVLGAIVRYRAIILPLWLISFIILSKNLLKQNFSNE